MSKAKHTPGMWAVLGPIGAGTMIGATDGETVFAHIAVVYGPSQTEDSAGNSKLIAASPTLLAACKLALSRTTDPPIETFLKDAIALAEGR